MDQDQNPVTETEEQKEDRGAFEGMTDAQLQRLLMFQPLAQKIKMARFYRDARKPRERPKPKPRKPAPKSRKALLEKKAKAQGWGEGFDG